MNQTAIMNSIYYNDNMTYYVDRVYEDRFSISFEDLINYLKNEEGLSEDELKDSKSICTYLYDNFFDILDNFDDTFDSNSLYDSDDVVDTILYDFSNWLDKNLNEWIENNFPKDDKVEKTEEE